MAFLGHLGSWPYARAMPLDDLDRSLCGLDLTSHVIATLFLQSIIRYRPGDYCTLLGTCLL